MTSEILKAKKEFHNENYEKALEILDDAKIDESVYKLAILIKSACFMNLKRYNDALTTINQGIEKYPYEEFLWSCKVECQYFNGDKKGAAMSLSELERIVDKNDKEALVNLAEKCELLLNHEKALKYCDMALDIDENFKEAIHQKSMVASSLDDYDMMSDCADKLLDLYDRDIFKVMLPFMLKLLSQRYRDCLDIINGVNDIDEDHKELLKGAIYNEMMKNLDIEILTVKPLEITVDESLNILFNYYYDDKIDGLIKGVRYFIKKSK